MQIGCLVPKSQFYSVVVLLIDEWRVESGLGTIPLSDFRVNQEDLFCVVVLLQI